MKKSRYAGVTSCRSVWEHADTSLETAEIAALASEAIAASIVTKHADDEGSDEDPSESDDDSDSDETATAAAKDSSTTAEAGKRKRTEGSEPTSGASSFAIGRQQYITPCEVRTLIKRLWVQDGDLLDSLFQCMGGMFASDAKLRRLHCVNADLFFITTLLVPPNKFRPISVLGDQKYEHSHNTILSKALESVLAINDLNSKGTGPDAPTRKEMVQKHLQYCIDLQNHVRALRTCELH